MGREACFYTGVNFFTYSAIYYKILCVHQILIGSRNACTHKNYSYILLIKILNTSVHVGLSVQDSTVGTIPTLGIHFPPLPIHVSDTSHPS